ncbi:MAG: acylphosphatase [Candidatus Omnitrophota bacterium]
MFQSHIVYLGTVQGVGFRYTVHRFASELDLVGWVRNLSDGSVEILVEGKKESIEELIKNIDEYFSGYIQDKKVTHREAEVHFKDFRIA